VARRATLIKQVREQADHPVLLLDAGNTLFGQWVALQSEGEAIIDAMNVMGYDAMTVGMMDLTGGVDTLRQRVAEAAFPILSSNLLDADQNPILPPYAILERDGLRIGIIGVTEPEAAEELAVRNITVHLLDPVETVQRYLPEVQEQADIVILLSHLGLEEDQALAGAIDGIDVIVGGRSRRLMQGPEVIGRTFIIQVGHSGEWLGRLDIELASGEVSLNAFEILFMRPDVEDDLELAALAERYKQQYPVPTPSR
jgi:2',3'-cyclic-nucleotide 2'-phosphodiesterase (5'-nucleotidase family)